MMSDQQAVTSDIICEPQQQQQQQQQQFQQQQQHEYHLETFQTSLIDSAQKEERGYTVVPASVSFKGVSMKLDLKIDQKTLAAATNISKAVEKAVSTHLATSGVMPMETDEVGSSQVPHTLPTSTTTAAQSFYSSFTTSESTNCTKEPPVLCDSSVESSTALLAQNEMREQVNEVCSSTVDASPFCDTACSPILLETQPKSQSSASNSMKCPDDTPPGSSEDQNGCESRSSVRLQMETMVVAPTENIYLTPCPSTSSGEVDTGKPSPSSGKRRKKTQRPSRLCEFIDKQKRQCRQRAIVGYEYCIRHILENKKAPYMRCQHQRKPKSRKDPVENCSNAVRLDTGDIYCSTHMIMRGLKKPKKKKLNGGTKSGAGNEGNDGEGNSIMNSSNSNPQPLVLHTLDELKLNDARRRQQERSFAMGNNAVPFGNLPNGVVVPMDSVVNQRMCRGVPKTPVAAVPLENIVTLQESGAAAPQNGVTSYATTSYDTGMKESPVLTTTVPSSNSCYGINPAVFEYPVATTSQNVKSEPPSCSVAQQAIADAQQVISETAVQTRVPLPIPQMPLPIKQHGTTNLTKQHPQLAAKLLQAPTPASASMQRVVPMSTCTTSRTPCAKTIYGSHSLFPGPRDILPFHSPCVEHQQEPPRFYKMPETEEIGKATVKQETNDELLPKKVRFVNKAKVIRLKQKRRRAKMLGPYLRIPQVNQMCKILEDQDFDRTDLFPLGLEPSDDEDEEIDNLGLRWPEMPPNMASDQGALQVYLLKKQLRIDKISLIREAIINAPIMHASKQYPNSVGAALADRAAKSVARGGGADEVHKRCSYTISNGSALPRTQCTEKCLPHCNHCSQHISYNLNQKIFKYCSESCCSQPVLFVDAPKTAELCKSHYEARERKRAEEALAQENAQQYFQQQAPISYVQQQPAQPYEDDVYMNMPPYYQSQNLIMGPTNPVVAGDFYENELGSCSGGNDSDGYLATVARDLGLDGGELNAMLADIGAGEGENGDFLRDQALPDGLKDDGVTGSLEFDPHYWDDVAQFLKQEGFRSSSPTMASMEELDQPTNVAYDVGAEPSS